MDKAAGVDAASPDAIARAIKRVNQTPGFRIKPGAGALWALFNAPDHTLSRVALKKEFGALDLHFGWFCRRVAEELGIDDPPPFALANSTVDADGQRLTLKPAVVSAMDQGRRIDRRSG
jgi:hypothetical protein